MHDEREAIMMQMKINTGSIFANLPHFSFCDFEQVKPAQNGDEYVTPEQTHPERAGIELVIERDAMVPTFAFYWLGPRNK